MASLNLQSLSLIVILLSMTTFPSKVNCVISSEELQSMLVALRAHSYNLFSNAITTSDILYDIAVENTTAARSFTIFAPTDASLFALDMTSTALLYTQILRHHIVPRRLSLADLRRVPSSGRNLHTLLPRRDLRVTRHRSPLGPGSDVYAVNGVEVVVPGLFYGRDVAVHGLASILNYRSPITRFFPVNRTDFPSPNTTLATNNRTIFHPNPETGNFLPVNFTVSPIVPRSSAANLSESPPYVHVVTPENLTNSAPDLLKSQANLPESALNTGNLIHSPATIPGIAAPPTNSLSVQKKFLETDSNVSEDEDTGEILAVKPWPRDEKDDETLAMVPEKSWPSDQIIETHVTGGDFVYDHVTVQAGNKIVLQEL